MAKTAFPFSNGLGDFSMYKQRGVDKIILRSKGGATKEKIKTSPKFKRTRELNAEFSAATKLAGCIKDTLFGVRQLGDFNCFGLITQLALYIQKSDPVNPVGKREILFSKKKDLLEGFSLNKGIPFSEIVKGSPVFTISREARSATVKCPELIPGINYKPAGQFEFLRFIFVLGVVSDVTLNNKKLAPANPLENYHPVQYRSIWMKPGVSLPAIELKLDGDLQIDDSCTMILWVGIEFGNSYVAGVIEPVKNVGAAKVLAVL